MASGGLRTASIVLFWCTAAATILVVAALARRRSAWTDFVDRGLDRDVIGRIDDADSMASAAFGLTFALGLATLIVVSIWSLRVGRRARAAGASDVSPGLACGSWYIPYASAIVPFVQLRRVARRWGRSTTMLGVWQACFIATWVTGTAVAGLEPDEEDAVVDVSDITDQLNGQLVFAVLSMIIVAVMAFVAMQAVRTIDDA